MNDTSDKDKGFSNNNKNRGQLYQQGTQQKQPLCRIDRIEADLNILDDDYMMSSLFRICKECGNDHSFKPSFNNVKTSVDIILQILSKKNSCC